MKEVGRSGGTGSPAGGQADRITGVGVFVGVRVGVGGGVSVGGRSVSDGEGNGGGVSLGACVTGDGKGVIEGEAGRGGIGVAGAAERLHANAARTNKPTATNKRELVLGFMSLWLREIQNLSCSIAVAQIRVNLACERQELFWFRHTWLEMRL